MLEEIRQQPERLERTLRRELKRVERFKRLVEKRRPSLVVLAARGTSDNAALFGRYLLEITTRIPVSLAAPSIYTLYNARVDFREALVIAVSQSGESTDTNLILSEARQQGALPSALPTSAPVPSRSSPSTSFSFTPAKKKVWPPLKLTLARSSCSICWRTRWAPGFGPTTWRAFRSAPRSALRLEAEIRELSERYRFMDHCVVMGRGLNYANAFEMSLKLMETCYVIAERFSSADFLHGPIAMVEPSFPVFVFAPSGVTWKPVREAIEKLKSLQAETVIITDAGNAPAAEVGTRVIRLPQRLSELYTPIPYIIPAQIFAACLAAQKGLDPDQPRTLTKVTLTL